MYKQRIEQMGLNLNILYIADASTDFPLKEECVDIFVDCLSSTTHCLYNTSFLTTKIFPYLKEDGQIIGAYVTFDRGAHSHENLQKIYPESMPGFALQTAFCERLRERGYEFTFEETGSVTETPKDRLMYRCHVNGERWIMNLYHACKVR